ncbi:MAG: DUF4292 domain-containing protein [Prevotella sp.]|nr:DUF4292 domain-containing protein [Prevotella sp.]
MMKLSSIVRLAALAVTLSLVSCGTHKKATNENEETSPEKEKNALIQSDFLKKVFETAATRTIVVSSKLKFTVEMGAQKLRLTGNLRMKRDDVIRLQLMAFGFVEAGRLEFTKDYVLIMDRINKQYLQVPYKYVDFLRNSNIDFYTLQALFWNELFIPGISEMKDSDLPNFDTNMGGDEAIIYLDRGKINYSWLANEKTGRIKMTNIMYRDPVSGNAQLNWDYDGYSPLNGKLFPDNMIVTLTLPQKEVKCEIKLTYLGSDPNWEPRTKVSDKYRKVEIDEILQRFMNL